MENVKEKNICIESNRWHEEINATKYTIREVTESLIVYGIATIMLYTVIQAELYFLLK